ncbi:MAG: hypothetical protein NPIRA02_36910 [Nitrospirales bacterium]|nr:MAG: hypothetical protein NPIRA02_36910 [Nitrospirales bacterium]
MISNCLNTVPSGQRLMVCLVAIGVIWAGFYALVWQPTTNEIEALDTNIRYLEDAIVRQKAKAAHVDTHRQHGVGRQNLQDVILYPPVQPVRPRKDVMEIATRFGLPLTFWMPERRDSGLPAEGQHVSMRGRIEGGYHRIAQCLASILELPWVIGINELRLRTSGDAQNGEGMVMADFQLLSVGSAPPSRSTTIIQNHM